MPDAGNDSGDLAQEAQRAVERERAYFEDQEHVCDWCLSKTCVGYKKCGGPTGPGIDEPWEF